MKLGLVGGRYSFVFSCLLLCCVAGVFICDNAGAIGVVQGVVNGAKVHKVCTKRYRFLFHRLPPLIGLSLSSRTHRGLAAERRRASSLRAQNGWHLLFHIVVTVPRVRAKVPYVFGRAPEAAAPCHARYPRPKRPPRRYRTFRKCQTLKWVTPVRL